MGVSCYPPFLVRNVIRMSRDAVLSPDLHLSIFVMHFVVEKIWIRVLTKLHFAPVQRGVLTGSAHHSPRTEKTTKSVLE